ncbi:MAG: hypothetical protein DMG05_23685 [Acidobacteria bacterium]|nr:MAG: hypothetical protein DMG05_23685 [Acidobacteriota bacterium]
MDKCAKRLLIFGGRKLDLRNLREFAKKTRMDKLASEANVPLSVAPGKPGSSCLGMAPKASTEHAKWT